MTILLDENMPPQIARALNLIQEALNQKNGTQVSVVSIVDQFERGIADEEWIPSSSGNVILTQDYRIQTTRHQKLLYEQHGLGMIFLKAGKKGLSFMEMTKLLVKHWEEIVSVALSDDLPFAYQLNQRGLKRFSS